MTHMSKVSARSNELCLELRRSETLAAQVNFRGVYVAAVLTDVGNTDAGWSSQLDREAVAVREEVGRNARARGRLKSTATPSAAK